MNPMLNTAIKAARKAANSIVKGFDRVETLKLTAKGKNDYATEVDFQAEQDIIAILRKAYPDHGIIAEESDVKNSGADCVWIIDPLDGTANFMRGLPHFAVSIALQVKGVLEQAVVYDPIKQELFTASKGSGAQLNDRRVRIKQDNTLEGGLISMVLPLHKVTYQEKTMALWHELSRSIAAMRRLGAASLDLSYVACNRIQGYCEMFLSPWDLAAGTLIVKEAGGLVTDFQGNNQFLQSGHVLAANSKTYAALMHLLEKHQFTRYE